MIGNVWEWTEDWYRARHPDAKDKPCCIPLNPCGGPRSDSHDRCDSIAIPRKESKGGSHLRAELLPALPAGRASSAAN